MYVLYVWSIKKSGTLPPSNKKGKEKEMRGNINGHGIRLRFLPGSWIRDPWSIDTEIFIYFALRA